MPSPRPLAHSAGAGGRPQDLGDHLTAVADLAAAFAQPFDSSDYARVAGLWHDLGKIAPDFQRRLGATCEAHVEDAEADGKKPGKVDHSSAGALYALRQFGDACGLPIAFAIAGHHCGLADKTDLLLQRLPAKRPRLEAVFATPNRVVPAAQRPKPPEFLHRSPGEKSEEINRRVEFWIRMLFSCLVDADFLDTERHFQGAAATPRGGYPSLAELKAKFDAYMAKKCNGATGRVNEMRQRVLADCRRVGRKSPQGVFKLTGPTGCGKTLAGMAFALEHAVGNGLDRVIVVIPYTSIIDQNAKVFREVFGAANVIDHHASIDPKTETSRNRVACENWDAPIVVTTSVQFLESLFANRTSKCRKLHSVAKSVVIFDEVQTLPVEQLLPIVDSLKELVANYTVSIVLSTATQPALERRQSGLSQVFPGFEGLQEIVSDVEGTFAALRRVAVEFPLDLMMPVTWPDLAVRVRQHDEVLAVVHRRDDARELATLVPNSIHLSALMCPNHRLHVLDEIKGRLAANRARRAERGKVEPVRIISTQLVEAGVDLDLPTVYRALGGFDSIAQAAGRCNREGLLPDGQLGRVIVFTAPTKPPPGTPQQGLDVARAMLANDPGLDALDPKLFDQYFRRLYFGRQLDAGSVQSLRAALRFKSVAEAFQVIADAGGVAVIVPYGDAPTRLEELRRDGPSRERLRALQPFAVTLYKQQVETLQKAGAIETIADTVLAVNATTHKNLYDPQFGLVLTGPLAADAEALCQ